MLAAWFRMKYPHMLDGAIAASAPIWAYLGEDPPVDPGAFAKIVTRDAWPEGGSAHECAGNVRVRCAAHGRRGAGGGRRAGDGADVHCWCAGCGLLSCSQRLMCGGKYGSRRS